MLLIPIITSWTESRTCVSHKYMFPQIELLLKQTNYHPYQPLISKDKGILIYSQGWHNSPVANPGEGVRGARLPPYTLTKMRPKGPKKFFFETAPPPLSLGLDDRHLPSPPPLIWRTGSATAAYEEIKTQVNIFQIHCRHFISTSLK